MFSPIPFQPSFDTSAFTNMYADFPFPSRCLDSEEEDGLGGVDHWRRDHHAQGAQHAGIRRDEDAREVSRGGE